MPPARDRSRRTAPTLADYGRSIWRRKVVVLVALCGGLVLGMTLLPTALAQGSDRGASAAGGGTPASPLRDLDWVLGHRR